MSFIAKMLRTNSSRYLALFSLVLLSGCTSANDIREGTGSHEVFTVGQDFDAVYAHLSQIATNCFRPGPVAGYMGASITKTSNQPAGSLQIGWHGPMGTHIWFTVDFHAVANGTEIHTAALGTTGGYRKFGPQVKKWVADPSVCDPDVSDQ